MKAKLIKINDYYYLQELSKTGIGGSQCERTLGTTNSQGELGKLSKQNCDEIFGVVDVEKLVYQSTEEVLPHHGDYRFKNVYEEYFKEGFNKAIELNKDKVFTLSNLRKAFNSLENHPNRTFTELVALLQQTEIEVEIIMKNSRTGNIVKHDSDLEWDEDGLCDRAIPKLDSQGCLILKKI
jgi:hypothetical protein